MTVDIEAQEPESTAMRFEILSSALKEGTSATARIGRLAFPGRRPIDTPNFIAVTSRGTLPHVTPDNISKHLQVSGAYFSLEDFVEKSQQNLSRPPPIFSAPTSTTHPTPLHSFTGTPSHITTLLAARRLPAVPSPIGNSTKSISIFTNTGFQNLSTTEYLSAISTLQPDISIPLADLTNNTTATPTSKRALRMAERTDEWIVDWFSSPLSPSTTTFAPVLPIPYPIQWEYLSRLAEDYLPSHQLSGLAIHDPDILPDLSTHQSSLLSLPLLSLSNPSNPHQILRHISLGIDLFTLPLITNAVSDAGIALDFTLPAPAPSGASSHLPLGIDLSLPNFKTAVSPLSEGCSCYACASHHRAYVHHLLQAREMLGWTLLQVHNHAVLSQFFSGIQTTIKNGTFERERINFSRVYDPEMPAGVGERPRARGYQYMSQGGEENAGKKRNKPAWRELGPTAEGETPVEEVPETTQTPVQVPEGDGAKELQEKGLGEVVKE